MKIDLIYLSIILQTYFFHSGSGTHKHNSQAAVLDPFLLDQSKENYDPSLQKEEKTKTDYPPKRIS